MSGSKRILYVEDDDHNYLLVEKALSVFVDLQVTRAISGEAALELLRDMTPDLLLLDLNLPGLDGYDILRAVRGMPGLQALPVLALTANAMAEEQDQAQRSGFTGFLAKPFALAALRRVVEEHLGALQRR